MSLTTTLSGSSNLQTTLEVRPLGVAVATTLGVLGTSLSVASSPVMITVINTGLRGPRGPAGPEGGTTIIVSPTPPPDPEVGTLWLDIS